MNRIRENRGNNKKDENKKSIQNYSHNYTVSVNSRSKSDSYVERRVQDSELIFENLTWLTSSEATEYLRLPSVGTLRVLVFKRQIPFHKLGRSLRFKKCELDRLLEASRIGGI